MKLNLISESFSATGDYETSFGVTHEYLEYEQIQGRHFLTITIEDPEISDPEICEYELQGPPTKWPENNDSATMGDPGNGLGLSVDRDDKLVMNLVGVMPISYKYYE